MTVSRSGRTRSAFARAASLAVACALMTGCTVGKTTPPKAAAKITLPSVSFSLVPLADASSAAAAFGLGARVQPSPAATVLRTAWALNGTHFGLGYVSQNTRPATGVLVVMFVDTTSQQWFADSYSFAPPVPMPTRDIPPLRWLPPGNYWGVGAGGNAPTYYASLWTTGARSYLSATVPTSVVGAVTGTPIHAGQWTGTLITNGASQSLLVPLADGNTAVFASLDHNMTAPMRTQALESVASSPGPVVTVKQSSSLPK